MTTLADLRANAFSPILFADRVPHGVLHDVGFAAWEMPATATRGGYMHYIRAPYHEDYELTLIPPLREQSGVITVRKTVEDVNNALHVDPTGAMVLADLSGVYASGNSLCLQNCVFAPDRTGGVDTAHDYVDEVTAIRAAWSGRLYVHVGVANNSIFPTGSPRFNIEYALACRSLADNPARILLEHAAFGIAPQDYVHGGTSNEGGLPDVNAVYHPFPRCVYDPTHPVVSALAFSAVAGIVGEFGTQLRYVVHGESGLRIGAVLPTCSTEPFGFNCAGCEPKTPYSAIHSAAFQAYLQDIVGLDVIADVNARWGTDLASFAAIDTTSPTLFCPGNPTGLRDYFDYLDFVGNQLGIQEAMVAKTANPSALVSQLRFGPLGCEQSGLDGDFGSVGDWGAETPDTYAQLREHPMDLVLLGGRLSGVPASCAITAPPAYRQMPPPPAVGVPRLMLNVRGYDDRPVGWFFRDILTAGSTHIGYYKAAEASLAHDPPSLTAITDGMEDIVSNHAVQFAGMGAWQRVILQVDDAGDLSRPELDNGSGRLCWHLVRRMRERAVPVAIMQSDRVRARPIGRWWHERSVVVVPYASELDTLQAEYATTFPDAGSGAAIFVEENAAAAAGDPEALPAWADDTVLLQTSRGVLYRDAEPTNCFYFAAMTARSCSTDDQNHDRVAMVLAREVIPHVTANYVADFVESPITLTPGLGTLVSDLAVNYVADGLNFTVAVANMQPVATSVTVGVSPGIAGALDVTYDPQLVSLAAHETKRVLLEAEPDSIDIAAAIADADAKLTVLEGMGAYDTAAGRAVLDQAGDLLAEHPGRALAAYIAAVRMPYVLTSFSDPDLTVTVRRIGIVGEADTSPVEGARVLLVWPLNGREEGADGLTDASGECVLDVGVPAGEHWDFATGGMVGPAAEAADVVEVHVTAQDSGASARAMVTLS